MVHDLPRVSNDRFTILCSILHYLESFFKIKVQKQCDATLFKEETAALGDIAVSYIQK